MPLLILAALFVAVPQDADPARPRPPAARLPVMESEPGRIRNLPHAVARMRIATYSDGAYITDINGQRRLPELRNGTMLVINGKGFDTQQTASRISLFDGPQTRGATLKIHVWTDTRIAAEIAIDQMVLPKDTKQARIVIQGVKPNGVWSRYELKNLRFVASR